GVRPGSAPLPGGAVQAGLDATRRAGFGPTPAAAQQTGHGFAEVPPPTAPVADDSVPADAVVLRFDSGAVHWFHGTCVIGRNPEAEPGVATVAVPDLSRTLSKTHVALVQA
ncbi:hypothetical protein, partial [Mycobacteroides abscessus]